MIIIQRLSWVGAGVGAGVGASTLGTEVDSGVGLLTTAGGCVGFETVGTEVREGVIWATLGVLLTAVALAITFGDELGKEEGEIEAEADGTGVSEALTNFLPATKLLILMPVKTPRYTTNKNTAKNVVREDKYFI